jgi:hypothetical protein
MRLASVFGLDAVTISTKAFEALHGIDSLSPAEANLIKLSLPKLFERILKCLSTLHIKIFQIKTLEINTWVRLGPTEKVVPVTRTSQL